MPGLVPATRVEDTVSTVDIASTVLAAAQLPDLPASEGSSLLDLARGGAPPGPPVAFSDFLNDRRVIRAGRFKLELRGINASLWDLEADPGETHEVSRHEHPVAMRYLRIMLGQWLGATDRHHWLDAEQGPGLSFGHEAAHVDETLRDQLRALGYAN